MKFRLLIIALLILNPLKVHSNTNLIATSSAAPGNTIKDHFIDFKKKLTQTFHGEINITLLVNGEAGSEEISLSSLRRNRVQMTAVSIAAAAKVIPELSVLMMPYLFKDDIEADFILDNFIIDEFKVILKNKGLHFVRWLDSGWAIIYGRKPIIYPSDIKNYSMRAASAFTSQIFLKILNADVIPLSFSDIIPSLQTGLINGGTTSPYMYLNAGIYEYAPYLTITNHALNPGIILINYDWFKYLSSLNQNSLLSAYAPSSVLRSDTRRQTCEAYSTLIKKGINIYTPNKNDNKFWKNSVVKDHKKILNEINGNAINIYDKIIQGKKAFLISKSNYKTKKCFN